MEFGANYDRGDELLIVFKAAPVVPGPKGNPLWHILQGRFEGWGGPKGGDHRTMLVTCAFGPHATHEVEVAREDVLFAGRANKVAGAHAMPPASMADQLMAKH